jgi:hypothetical protein
MNRLFPAAMLPILCAPLLAQSVHEIEPNDTAAAANLIVPGVQSYGDIGPMSTDVDYYMFTLAAAADVRAMTSPGFGSLNQVDDTVLTLVASDGVTGLDYNDDFPGRGRYSQITAGNLPAGTYYLRVESFLNAQVGSYTLDLVVAPNCDIVPQMGPIVGPVVAEGAEPNDPRRGRGVATPTALFTRNLGYISTATDGQSYTSLTSDYDFWAFTVAAPGPIVLMTCSTGFAPSPAATDTVVFLADASFAVLAFNDDWCNMWSQLNYNITVPGQYYAVVKGFTGSTGYYHLDIIGSICNSAPITNAVFTQNVGGCPGTNGLPTLGVRNSMSFPLIYPERPLIGTEFVMDVTNVPASTALIEVLGFAALPLPGFDLGPLGAAGCFVEVSPIVNTIAFTSATGDAFWRLPIPYNLALCGLHLQLQAAVFDPPANLLGITVSNRGSAVVGNGY